MATTTLEKQLPFFICLPDASVAILMTFFHSNFFSLFTDRPDLEFCKLSIFSARGEENLRSQGFLFFQPEINTGKENR
jgi:hypothetical protein